MSTQKDPGEWTVQEIYKSPGKVLLEVTPSGSYNPDEWWPKVGEILVRKPK